MGYSTIFRVADMLLEGLVVEVESTKQEIYVSNSRQEAGKEEVNTSTRELRCGAD